MAAHGYVTDTSYTDQFFRELAPAWLNYVAAVNGATPVPLDRPFVYLELGCGFGTSTVVNAGAYPQGKFHGCDIITARDGLAAAKRSYRKRWSKAVNACLSGFHPFEGSKWK